MALLAGTLLDRIVGDPHGFPHPIRAIGSLILVLERRLLGVTEGNEERDAERNPRRERRAGFLLWIIVVTASLLVSLGILIVGYRISLYIGLVIETIMTCYLLAAGSLYRESMAVSKALHKNDKEGAAKALSMIVGRDTENLSEEEIVKAAVETVAENTSDGVIAPLLYTAIGGPAAGFAYKAVNTMDSMLGYRNERYEHFGFFAAKADDVFNYLPARISALFMIAAAYVLGLWSEKTIGEPEGKKAEEFSGKSVGEQSRTYSGKKALQIYRRDRRNHLSPNSAQTESVCAGALGLQLGGTHSYHGVLVEKPVIGDALRKAETEDIARANRLMFTTEGLLLPVLIAILLLFVYCLL
ncbi:MAG: adenosylcobinamide-phosphate synthase CbiB [Lachnospiraceae bacterium]|nr:adenosylcobinamide-phosphate synthase CbiB [Lachnospiraceae bacterium]